MLGEEEGGGIVHQVLHHGETLAGLQAGRVELVELNAHMGGLGHLPALGRLHVVAVQLEGDGRTGTLNGENDFLNVNSSR